MTRRRPIPGSFYDRDYFTTGTKSNYAPYGPGGWADDLVDMIWNYYHPTSVLDVGCAFGYLVDRFGRRGIPASGFDISEYAVAQANSPNVWVGDASKVESYRHVDLIVATELPEHLTEKQARLFLSHAYTWAERAILLIAMYADGQAPDMQHEKDKSHINIKPISWWQTEALQAGWQITSAEAINEDPRSERMGWLGRFMYLTKEN